MKWFETETGIRGSWSEKSGNTMQRKIIEESRSKQHRQKRGEKEEEKSGDRKRDLAGAAPEQLLVIESCFLDKVDCVHLLHQVPLHLLLEWETTSGILRDGLRGCKWWETNFKMNYEATYQRMSLESRQECAKVVLQNPDALSGGEDVWRGLTALLARPHFRVWKENLQLKGVPLQARYGVQSSNADEFGIDSMYQLAFDNGNEGVSNEGVSNEGVSAKYIRTFCWNISNDDSMSLKYFDVNKYFGKSMVVVSRLWAVPFRKACIVLVQSEETGNQELIWVWVKHDAPHAKKLGEDLRYWAINHNVLAKDKGDFIVPILFGGGANAGAGASGGIDDLDSLLLRRHPVLVCSIDTCTSVILDGKFILIFDRTKVEDTPKNKDEVHANWRCLLTDEICESKHNPNLEIVITASCFVLDSFLLLATNDGVLRARPRNNPKSEYFVEDFGSLIAQMTSLFNVVAIVHTYHILEVRWVLRQAEDPFIHFAVAYQTNGVDCDHPVLLYGPYVIFAGLDGCWYRVLYDSRAKVKEEIKIPYRAGWKILSVKNANWRYLTLVVQDPVSQRIEELFLLSK